MRTCASVRGSRESASTVLFCFLEGQYFFSEERSCATQILPSRCTQKVKAWISIQQEGLSARRGLWGKPCSCTEVLGGSHVVSEKTCL